MKEYEFSIRLIGIGKTEDEAWDNAVDNFIKDPGTSWCAEIVVEDEIRE